jgi:diguanylate cyclase (GGDEF)-like protein
MLQPQGTEERVRHSFAHLLDAFAALTAVRDGTDQIIDFRVDYANDGVRAAGAAPQDEVDTDPRESLAERHKRELFDDFCHVVETGEPLATQSFEYEDADNDTGRIARSFEVRAERIGDGLAVVWRDVTAHVLVETELEQRNQELALVGEMVEYLQAVESSDEVFEIAASFCSRLFGGVSAGLFLRNESGHVLEAVTSWGDLAGGDQVFPPESCWAMRRGKRHGSLAANDSPRCAHAADDAASLLCIPLITQGQETGLLVLVDSACSAVSPSCAASEALAVSVCEHLGLALTNIRLRESLREQSIRDPLTGLFNLRYLEETLKREISRSTRSGKPVGLMMLDVDHFKAFNDTFGHPGGDALLCELSNLLQSVTRVEDAACRYGGDEFVVLLPESSLDITLERAEDIRKAAARFNITHEGDALDPVTLTVGVAVYPDHATDMTGLLRAADEAMYEAKHAGGDRVLVAQAASNENAATTSS